MKQNVPDRARDDDLLGVIAEESHRGRPGVLDTAMRQRIRRQNAGFIELVNAGASDDEIVEALTLILGRAPDAGERRRALQACRSYRAGR